MLEYKFDTQLLIEGEDLDEDAIHDYLMENIPGDKIAEYTRRLAKALHVKGLINIQFIAVGDEDLIKIHYHTNLPWQVLEYCAGLGEIHDIVVENMERQAGGQHG